MLRRFPSRLTTLLGVAVLASALLVAPANGAKTTTLLGKVTFPAALSGNVPVARVTFNQPVSASQMPSVKSSPSLPTKWQQIGPNEVQAVTTADLVPDTQYHLQIPAHLRCATSCVAFGYQNHVTEAGGNIQWLQELLAKLDFLPVKFTPSKAGPPTAYLPGTFTWKFPNLPNAIKEQWAVGAITNVTYGAIMRFQSEHGLEANGVLNSATWTALLRAAQVDALNTGPYDYVTVSEVIPETLTLYRNGHVYYTSLVNTGVASAPTQTGTWPVYARYTVTTMSGTYPDGQKYSDPGIPWVSYFHGGDALHGFLRYSYGYPQSLGCVEMPFANAHHVFPWTPIGTLVTVF